MLLGVYLPLLWEQSFCWKSPVALGYTRGHFSALVPMEPDTGNDVGAGANIKSSDDLKVSFLPLTTSDGKLLPVHFLTSAEVRILSLQPCIQSFFRCMKWNSFNRCK